MAKCKVLITESSDFLIRTSAQTSRYIRFSMDLAGYTKEKGIEYIVKNTPEGVYDSALNPEIDMIFFEWEYQSLLDFIPGIKEKTCIIASKNRMGKIQKKYPEVFVLRYGFNLQDIRQAAWKIIGLPSNLD